MFDGISAALGVTIIAAILLVIINAFYRFLVNQDKIADTKARMQELTKESKAAPTEKQKELMSQSMKLQKDMMHMNMKPMLLSLVVVAVLLPWLGAVYNDINVGLGNGAGSFSHSGVGYAVMVSGSQLSITGAGSEIACSVPCDLAIGGNTWHATLSNDKLQLSLVAAVLPDLPLIGGWQLGWIWWYILVTIPLAIIVRAAYGIRA